MGAVEMRSKKHSELKGNPDCPGILRRNGWLNVDVIDGDDDNLWKSWYKVPSWKCDVCGREFWGWSDTDNGDESEEYARTYLR